MSTRSFRNLLSSPELAKLNRLAHAQRQLDARWQSVLPPELVDQTRVVGIDGDCLVVSTRSSAVVAKLRQMEVRLVKQLVDHGLKVTAVRCRVQVETLPHEIKKTKRNLVLSDAAVQAFDVAVQQMPESPVRDAMAQLVKRRRDKLA